MMDQQKAVEQKGNEIISEEQVYAALKTCCDPEIPVNVVDLGLIYDIKIIDDWVGVKMTLTTPGCGMGNYIANNIREKMLDLPGVHEADVRIVWEPQWTPAMMSDQARKMLGIR